MWLLDVNLPNGVIGILKGFGIDCDTTVARGWRDLGNVALASVASKSGFKAVLTRDRLFGESAAKALHSFPELSIVIIRISQSKQSAYVKEFEVAWQARPIKPIAGMVVEWP